MLVYICMKLHEDTMNAFQAAERTRSVIDRQTDGQINNNMSRTLQGVDIKSYFKGEKSHESLCIYTYNSEGDA